MARILLADDDPIVRTILLRALESHGHEVRIAADGVQAETSAKDWKPDLLISDIDMPEAHGPDAVRKLQGDPATAGIPILFVSGVSVSIAETLIGAVRKGSRKPDRIRLMHKPVNLGEFERNVNELLKP